MFLFLFLTLSFLSLISTKDVFSPGKIYLAVIFVFFGDAIFSNATNISFQLIISILLIFGFLIICAEKFGFKIQLNKFNAAPREVLPKSFVYKLWLLTLVPVVAQILFVYQMGGITGYFISIGERVYAWKGYGLYLLLIRLISIISYCYFFYMMIHSSNRKNKLLFTLHFMIFISLALLSGSRSMLLWNLVYMVILYHYMRYRVNFGKALLSFGIVVFLAMMLGAIRDGYKMNDDGFSTGIELSEKLLNMANFTYGTKPIHLLLDINENYDYSFGKTYLTVFSNLVPRGLWVNKPDPGGIVFTRDILGDPFGGFSYYSTGIFGEAFINFGLIAGSIFAVVQLFILYLFLAKYISNVNNSRDSFEYRKLIGYYPFLLLGIPAYLYAEFTTNTLSMFFFKIFLFYLVVKFTCLRIKI
ncbi:O-antigen polymerase [Vibrio misgurnus]|uniref:O-antigen polymerase n=1 Tax=Vibrio misgurnus TaxID=2993714 RepID=UPI00241673DE|nr:O-antigen polymerase [Vibrio sp. gvc]